MNNATPEPTLWEYLVRLDNEFSHAYPEELVQKSKLIRMYLDRVDQIFPSLYPFYTLHDVHHSDTVVDRLSAIAYRAELMERSSVRALSRYEAFYLIAS